MFSDDVNQGTIDVVDGYTKNQDDYIFSHSCAVRVSITRYVVAMRWVHRAGLLCTPVSEKDQNHFFDAKKHIKKSRNVR